jgi:hypothetical protein
VSVSSVRHLKGGLGGSKLPLKGEKVVEWEKLEYFLCVQNGNNGNDRKPQQCIECLAGDGGWWVKIWLAMKNH